MLNAHTVDSISYKWFNEGTETVEIRIPIFHINITYNFAVNIEHKHIHKYV